MLALFKKLQHSGHVMRKFAREKFIKSRESKAAQGITVTRLHDKVGIGTGTGESKSNAATAYRRGGGSLDG